MPLLELAAADVEGLRIAATLPLDRVELGSALELGGLTPSPALIECGVEVLAAPDAAALVILIRPRPGGFDYSADEVALCVRDIRFAAQAGASGVVIGALRAGRVDRAATSAMVDAADGADVTFHRAFDLVSDQDAALLELAELGVHGVLTSGGASSAAEGAPVLSRLAALTHRPRIMAGAGITSGNCRSVAATGVEGVHFSAKRAAAASAGLALGSSPDSGAGGHQRTDAAEAAAIVAALRH